MSIWRKIKLWNPGNIRCACNQANHDESTSEEQETYMKSNPAAEI